MKNHIQEEISLTKAAIYILLSLTPDKKHGYVIMKDIAITLEIWRFS